MDYIMETQPMDFQDDTLSDTEDRVRVGNLNITSSDSTSIQKFAVYEGINLIGREESCNIQLISKSISKKHAIIEINDNAQFVYDLGSRNKTRKGKMVFKPYVKYPLESEEIITFGDMRGIFTTTRKKAGALLDDDATDSMSDDDSCSETDSESMLPIINDSILDGESNLEKNVDMEKQVDMLLAGNLENTESKIPERITPEHSENNSTTVEKELNEPSPIVINPTPGFLPKKRSYKLHQDSTIPENTTNNSSEILSTLQQHQTLKQDVHISETNFNSHDADNSTEKNPHTEVAETIDDTADSPELTATMPVEHDSPKGHFSSAWNYANEEAVVDSDETDNDEDCINSLDDIETQQFVENNTNQITNTQSVQSLSMIANDSASQNSIDDLATQPYAFQSPEKPSITSLPISSTSLPGGSSVSIASTDAKDGNKNQEIENLELNEATQRYCSDPTNYDDIATQAFVQDSPSNINKTNKSQVSEIGKDVDFFESTQRYVGETNKLNKSFDNIATQDYLLDSPIKTNKIAMSSASQKDKVVDVAEPTQGYTNSYDDVATQAFPININTIDKLQTTLNKNDDALNTSDDEISTQPFVGELKDSYDDVATQAFPVNINTIDKLQTTLDKNDDALNTSDDEISTQPFVGELKNIDSKEESEIPYVDNSVDDDDDDMNVMNQSFDTDDTALNKAESQYFFDETIPSSESEDEENSDPSKNDSDSKSETNNFDPQSAEKKVINQSVLKGVFETAISPKNNPTEKPIDSDSSSSHNSSRENKTIACGRRGKRKATKSIKDYCFRKTSQENVENDTVSSNISNEHEANETNVLSTDGAMQTKKLSVEKEKTNTGSSSKAGETPENAMETARKRLNEIENNENVEDKKEKKSNTDNSFNASATSSLAKKQTRKTRARKKLNPPRKNSRSLRNNLNAMQNNSQSEIEDLHENVTDKSLNKKEKQTKTNNKVTKIKSVITTDIETEEETKMDFTVSVSHQENSNDSNKTSNSSNNNNDAKKNNQNKTHTDEQETISSRSKRLSKRKIESNMKSNSQKKNRTSETLKTVKTRSIDSYYEETNQKSQPKINKLNSNNEKSSSSPSSSSPKNNPKNIKLNERKVSLNENSNVDISSSTSVTNSPPKTRDRRKTAINEQSGVSTSSNSVVNSTNKSKIRGKIAINKQPDVSTSSSSITDSPNKTRSRKRAAVSEQPDVSTSSIVDPLNKTKNESEVNSVNKHSSSSFKHDASSKAKSNVEASNKKRSSVSSPLSSQVSQSPNSSKSRRKSTVNEKYNVIFTGISHKAMEKVIKDAGGNVVDCISNATVLVTDKVRRTVKFLCALSKGIPIVGESWLTAIKSRKMFPNPQEYLLVDKNSEKQYEFSLERSLQTASETPLLKDFEIYVTNKVQPDPKAMKEIVTSAGGKFLNKQPTSAKGNLIVISCPEDKSVYSKLLKQKICVCTSELILKGVLQQKVDTTLYVIEENIGRKTSSNESAIDPENKTKDVPNKKMKLDTASNTNSTKKSTNRKSTRTRTSSK